MDTTELSLSTLPCVGDTGSDLRVWLKAEGTLQLLQATYPLYKILLAMS